MNYDFLLGAELAERRGMSIHSREPVAQLAARNLAYGRVLVRHGIDFCSLGNIPLEDACRSSHIPLDVVLRELSDAPEELLPAAPYDLRELVRYLTQHHHVYVRTTLAALRELADQMLRAHEKRHPELRSICRTLGRLGDEIPAHIRAEEILLFPYIVELANACDGAANVPRESVETSSLVQMTQRMQCDHTEVISLLEEIRRHTRAYTPPAGAPESIRALYESLLDFDTQLKEHFRLENDVLFPRARELERGLSRPSLH